MRITAVILAIFVAFLAIKPSVDLLFEQHFNIEQACCEVECVAVATTSDSSPVSNKGCEGQNCNPFQVCNASILFLNPTEWKATDARPILSSSIPTYTSRITSSFISDCWHPPQIV